MLKNTLTRGIEFQRVPTRVRNGDGTTANKGDMMMFDLALTSTLATNLKYGDDNSGSSIVVTPDTAQRACGFVCILAEDIAPGQWGRAWLKHDDLLGSVNAAVAIYKPLGIQNGRSMDTTPVAGTKVVGALLEASTGAGLFRCVFNGVEGIGSFG